ncbi:MAG: hypothetical protein JW828_10550 [Sedimentisphaerales bacterium]|nr:hypothetical protein [Sedimentisphaerales bacterium]
MVKSYTGKLTITIVSITYSVLFLLSASTEGHIVNFRNDPDLAKAMEYDYELTHDRQKANRNLAEKYYLAYLERENESFQRARVYLHMGVLYLTAFSPEQGESPDWEKGQDYLQKALKEEPDRISRETLRTRTMLASSYEAKVDRLKARIENYDFFLSLNEGQIRSQWLPYTLQENTTGPNEKDFQLVVKRLTPLANTTAMNMVSDARNMPASQRKDWLHRIVDRFPNTEAATLAQKELDKLSDQQTEASTTIALAAAPVSVVPGASRVRDSLQAALTTTTTPSSLPTDPTIQPEKKVPLPVVGQSSTKDSAIPYATAGLAVLLAGAALLLFLKRRRL